MTTTDAPRAGVTGTLLGAALATAGLGVVLAVVAGLVQGGPAARGSLVGAVLVAVVLCGGSLLVSVAAGVAPRGSVLVALLTYTLQLVVMAGVLLALARSGALEQALDRRWLAAAVIGGTLVWSGAQVVLTTRARVPAFDLDAPSPTGSAPAAGRSAR